MQHGVRARELDRPIVAALQLNGRASCGAIAKQVGSSESTVLYRAGPLTESGQLRVIGVADVLRCGLGVPVLVRFRCDTASRVAAVVAARPETRYTSVLTGSADCTTGFVMTDVSGHRPHAT
jgi:DNA-binding Lrp family transcriptional regulator